MRNKKNTSILLILMGVIVFFLIPYLYSNVNGAKISKLIKSDQIDKIQIVKTYETSGKTDVIEQVILNHEQRAMLHSLLENTKFKRYSSGWVPYYYKERYIITAETSDNTVFFRLESYGNEFALVESTTKISGSIHILMIQNKEWKNTIEKIIGLAN